MTNEQKIALLNERMHVLSEKEDGNVSICRKIGREIRKLQKQA